MPIPTGDLLDTKQAAALLGVHEITLVVWRRERRGPPYVAGKDVRLVLYRRKDLDTWLASNLVKPAAVLTRGGGK
jgi:Helix-turn-helix domain